jgi:hypothetical protein
MHVGCFESIGCLKYYVKHISSHSFLDLLLAPVLLMGPKSLDSIVGTKPTTEAQLDSAAFNNGMVLHYRWDLANLSMGIMFSCEGSSFSSNYIFCIFSWVGPR